MEVDLHLYRVKKEATKIAEEIEIKLREIQFKYGRMDTAEKFSYFMKLFDEIVKKRQLENIKEDLRLHCAMNLYWVIDDGLEH